MFSSPPKIYKAFLVLMAVIYLFLPVGKVIVFPVNLIGIAIFATGAYLALKAKLQFNITQTPIEPTAQPERLHTSGLFKYSRNPMYLGITIGLFGFAVLTGVPINFIFPVIFVVIMNYKFIPTEERNLDRTFPEEYASYSASVRRWI